jgi:hypothetical protein
MSGGDIKSDRPGGGERLSQLGGGLAGFEVDDEALAAIDRQRELALGETERAARVGDGLAEFLAGTNVSHLPDREYNGDIRKFARKFFPIGKIIAYNPCRSRNSYRSGIFDNVGATMNRTTTPFADEACDRAS